MYADYPVEQKRDRREDPPVSIYLIRGDQDHLDKLSCMFCKRTICDFKGRIDKIVNSPIDPEDFGIAVNIQCKLCHQRWRLVLDPMVYQTLIKSTFIEINS